MAERPEDLVMATCVWVQVLGRTMGDHFLQVDPEVLLTAGPLPEQIEGLHSRLHAFRDTNACAIAAQWVVVYLPSR